MAADGVKYPSNVLEGFGSGALLDLRVRLACDFLKHSPLFAREERLGSAGEVACFALDIAAELLGQAEARGWVEPLPADDGELPPDLRAQANRTGAYQAEQQLGANRYAQNEAGRVVPPARVVGNGRMN